MKISSAHAPYIGNKVAVDLTKSGMVTMTRGVESVADVAKNLVTKDIKKEAALEERVNELIDENEEQIEFYLADEKQLFWMFKKKLAAEYGVILDHEERFSQLAHDILDELYEEDLINYDVSDNMVRNIIFDAIDGYLKTRYEIEEVVIEKMSHYKRKLIPGSDEYDIMFNKLFEQELVARGMAQ
jgi:hypothetical protein